MCACVCVCVWRFRQNYYRASFSPIVPHFAARISRVVADGGTWRLKWERLKVGESNGKLLPRTCPVCSVPEPYRSHDWALVPAKPGLQGWILVHEYMKVKWSRYRSSVAQKVGRGIALLFQDRGTRRGESSAARPGRTLPPGKTRYPLYRRMGGLQGRSGRAENLVPSAIRFRTIQPVAQSLYRLSYPAHNIYICVCVCVCV